VLAGLLGGLGLSIHFIFICSLAYAAWLVIAKSAFRVKTIASWWIALIGLWAGFAIQFAMISLHSDDQDRNQRAVGGFLSKLSQLPKALAVTLSGSSYVAVYTGKEFSAIIIFAILVCLALFIGILLLSNKWRWVALTVLVGVAIQVVAVSYFVAYFTIRYFTIASLSIWCLAGLGAGLLISAIFNQPKYIKFVAIGCAVGLMTVSYFVTVRPYLATNGSFQPFTLGYRHQGSDSFIATNELVACVKRHKGFVWADDGTIIDRLQYLQLGDPHIYIAGPDGGGTIFVGYRKNDERVKGELCPKARHFILLKKDQPSHQ
jgi:hypothetical protein